MRNERKYLASRFFAQNLLSGQPALVIDEIDPIFQNLKTEGWISALERKSVPKSQT
jgi:hypothetical protein